MNREIIKLERKKVEGGGGVSDFPPLKKSTQVEWSAFFGSKTRKKESDKELYSTPSKWDWVRLEEKKELESVKIASFYPDDFLFGVSTAGAQYERRDAEQGDSRGKGERIGRHLATRKLESNWDFYERENLSEERRKNFVKYKYDGWTRCEEDLNRIAGDNMNFYRFSLEWSRIEKNKPEKVKNAQLRRTYDRQALDRYWRIIDTCRGKGIKPMVTLHHFSHPLWFEMLGGFSKRENVDIFVDYCKDMYREFGSAVELWITFNEPEIFSINAYFVGIFPPGQTFSTSSMDVAMKCYLHMLSAHVKIYKEFHAMALKENGKKNELIEPKVGISKQSYTFRSGSAFDFVTKIAKQVFDDVFNEVFYEFFFSGTFDVSLPFITKVHEKVQDAKGALDFLGLNSFTCSTFWCTDMVKIILGSIRNSLDPELEDAYEEISYDIRTSVCPEELHDSVISAYARLGKPIYITENGIMTNEKKDSTVSYDIRRNMYALGRAIHSKGIPVKGYAFWTMTDFVEWNAYPIFFGLYDREGKLKRGTASYVKIVGRHAEMKAKKEGQIAEPSHVSVSKSNQEEAKMRMGGGGFGRFGGGMGGMGFSRASFRPTGRTGFSRGGVSSHGRTFRTGGGRVGRFGARPRFYGSLPFALGLWYGVFLPYSLFVTLPLYLYFADTALIMNSVLYNYYMYDLDRNVWMRREPEGQPYDDNRGKEVRYVPVENEKDGGYIPKKTIDYMQQKELVNVSGGKLSKQQEMLESDEGKIRELIELLRKEGKIIRKNDVTAKNQPSPPTNPTGGAKQN